jgi:hypothetical protein
MRNRAFSECFAGSDIFMLRRKQYTIAYLDLTYETRTLAGYAWFHLPRKFFDSLIKVRYPIYSRKIPISTNHSNIYI